jgi:hypothetical protein
MHVFGLLFGAVFGTFSFSGQAAACSVMSDLLNNPMTVLPDCSFENADHEAGKFGRDTLSGNKALDRGNGRVAQKLSYVSGCTSSQTLVFTECESGASIAISGISNSKPGDIEIAGSQSDSIKFIQPPHGPIRADSDDTVKSLSEQSKKEGYSYTIRGQSNDERGYWTRYKSNCGCKLFYPDSKAATARWARTGN